MVFLFFLLHFFLHSQYVVVCKQQLKMILLSHEQQLSHMALKFLQFFGFGFVCWNALLPSLKSPSLKLEQFCTQLKTTVMVQPF